MKTGKLTLVLAAFMLASAAFVTSCKKKTSENDTDSTDARDNNLAESTSNDVVSMGAQASESSSLSTYKLNPNNDICGISCADTVKVDTVAKTIRVHFNSSTVCMDGRTRSGVIIFDFHNSATGAKHYRNPGFQMHITTQNYMVDGNSVSIDKTVINNTPASLTGNLTWSVNGSVTIIRSAANGSGTITWTCNRTKTLLNTSGTYAIGGTTYSACYTNQTTPINWATAIIKIDGSASGISAKGTSFNATANGLIRNMNCSPAANPHRHPFVEGSIDFTPSGKVNRHVDYGDGSCDLLYTVTINGVTYGPYTLP